MSGCSNAFFYNFVELCSLKKWKDTKREHKYETALFYFDFFASSLL